ncbi:unnamed protein product [Schistosoma margrebowiei]|uniref:Uncharacterized protein n=1 Tax=Schistosoma margrebowiei TaxID=48269 RepID=A0A3P8EBC0_9TREM|nr:unnamed protein product [Schistosoma margrebowiei]
MTDSCFELHVFFNCRNATPALPILAFTSASDPPCSSMMLPKYVKGPTSSRVSSSSAIRLVFSVLYLRILCFPLCMFMPTDAEASATDLQ